MPSSATEKKLQLIIRLASEILNEGQTKSAAPVIVDSDLSLDYDIGDRAFFKKHGKTLSGPKRFVLVVAFLAKGETTSEVKFSDVKDLWNKMSGLLGGKLAGGTYATRAKNEGWVKSPKRDIFNLTNDWTGIFPVPK